jgi:hypothetical protein
LADFWQTRDFSGDLRSPHRFPSDKIEKVGQMVGQTVGQTTIKTALLNCLRYLPHATGPSKNSSRLLRPFFVSQFVVIGLRERGGSAWTL